MSIVEIAVGKSKYKIECPENEQEKLLRLALRVDEKTKKISSHLKHADDKTLLAIAAITLEEELETQSNKALVENGEEKIFDSENKNKEDDTYDALSENIENIAIYIEKLAKKIENY